MNRPLKFLLSIFILMLAGRAVGGAEEWLPDKKSGLVVKSVEAKSTDLPVAKITVEHGPAIYIEGPIQFRRANGSTARAKLEDLKPGVRIRAHGAGEATRGFHADKVLILVKE